MQNRAKKALELDEFEDMKSEREAPQSTKSAKNTATSMRKPPSSGKANRKVPGDKGDSGDTFLTDMLFKGEAKQQQRRQNKATFQSATKPQLAGRGSSRTRQASSKTAQKEERVEEQSNVDSDLEEEYKDTVFDFEQSKALVQMADDYLDNKPLLALMAPGSEYEEDDTQSLGGVTQQTGMTSKSKLSDKSKISINKRNVGKYGALMKQR